MGSKLQVAAILPLYPPRSKVGAWVASHGLLRGLADRGHEVRVVTFLARTPPYWLDGIRVEPSVLAQKAVAQADVVIAHLGTSGRDPLTHLRYSAPTVRIVHGVPFDPHRLQGCSLAVANSQVTATELARRWPTGTVVTCHPPTDPADFRVRPGKAVGIVNLAKAKGGDLFWEIAARMPDVAFVACRGGYGTQIERPASNVDLMGPNVVDMRDFYRRIRLLLVPSRAETWGIVAVEAAASGIPTLGRPLPGLCEALGPAGNWLDSEDPGPWVEATRALLGSAHAPAAKRARARSRALTPTAEVERFADAIEAMA